MLINPRLVPVDLQKLRILDARMKLSEEEKLNYFNLEKGYEGELIFDNLTNDLKSDNLMIRDLLLKTNNSLFQVDTTMIFQKTIYLLDVKNYEGEYCFKTDGYFKINDQYPKKDPLAQLKRAEVLFRQFIQKLRFNLSIEAYLIFINPEFTLYQPAPNSQIILPSQVNKFVSKLNNMTSKLTTAHAQLGDKLIASHISESPYSQVPHYTYEALRKGHKCPACHSFSIFIGRTKITCNDCGHVETIEAAVLRSVEEIRLLFPEVRITTSLVEDWCNYVISKKQIRRILWVKYTLKGHGKYSYFDD
jgi:hypothetical protein